MIVAYFKILYWNVPGGTGWNHEGFR